MPTIDAHQHFWNLERVSYPWLTAMGGPICRNFEPRNCSDWPVSVLADGYPKVWTETAKILADLSPDDRAQIYGGTAQRFYRLQLSER